MGFGVDCLVIGAGVVGLAVARNCQLAGIETVVVDEAGSFGTGTSSRNSEVIHAGIYYRSGSLKARHCVRGNAMLYDYCQARAVRHRMIGKIIVATTEAELGALEGYQERARANAVPTLEWLDACQIRMMEPAVKGVGGLLSRSTGIIDSHAYMLALLHDFEMAGGTFVRNTKMCEAHVTANGFLVMFDDKTELRVHRLVNSCGLRAPDVAATIAGYPVEHCPTAHFAVGHYYTLSGKSPFNRLVYPVAPPGGLGVHVTIDMNDGTRFGPDVRWIDGVNYQFDDSRRSEFVAAIRRYYPELDERALQAGYTGIRPKIAGPDQPDLDFVIQTAATHGVSRLVNLFGIESPGLTASLSIAETVVSEGLQ